MRMAALVRARSTPERCRSKNAEVGFANPFKPPGVKASADRCRGGALDWACDFAQSYHEVRRQSILRCSEDHRRTRFEDGRMGDASSLH
jgi:hypothetical protein